jgi:ribose 5-phosphate isomerase B
MEANPKTLIIGCDHAAVGLKNAVKAFLEKACDVTVTDVGTFDETSVDYPEYGFKVARAVAGGHFPGGILICGTGLGMSMVANRVPRVRAALCGDIFSAEMSRRHNDANVLVLGGRVVGDGLALAIARTWWETPFEGGRHQRRLDRFDGTAE